MSTEVERFIGDPEGMQLYQQERLLLDISQLIDSTRRKKKMKRMALAKMLGCTRGRITQILNGNENLTLRTIADAFTAMGQMLCIKSKDISLVESGWEFAFPDQLEYTLHPSSNAWLPDPGNVCDTPRDPLGLAA